ncbi:MAG: AarF/ABC1/UbiB kinase family protein [Proteobacteria bacterium]|nr:AarF/ABC1/UbiB kinase family protein [Pseudomonadota bacterium]MBU1389318.1 AarF/ABC1/UbiB kinase family protein [Pseudomonadota bacterium]MBU1544138.1 AarF/ABC1/UbiB kinase family protein [Pseudomonadota bacterium]MBU2482725.1 AarF/ABC1/UbiB kinase family protein [Pseudomonadota bacterium]
MLSIKNIGRVGKRYRHILRYQQIIGIILKYGFENIISAMNIDRYIESGLQLIPFVTPHDKVEKLSSSQRIRMALEELGPTFIKMGQVLSSRPDLIPLDLLNELTKLQDHVPGFSFDDVKTIIAAEFGKPYSEIFESMEEKPFASASIGQVHRARLSSERLVAVKIQRPGIKKTIEIDLEIIHHLASIMENNIEEAAIFNPVKIVEEFAKALEKEIDYSIEASNMERMALQFVKDKTIHIPEVYTSESSQRVLTMEYIQGIKANDIDAIDAAGLDRRIITRRGADFIMKQVFEFGFFHADPHPGNIFILEKNRICPIDFGMTGFVDQSTRELFVDLIHSIATGNFKYSAQLICRLSEYDTQPNLNALEKDISFFVSAHLSKSLKNIQTARMVNQFLELCAAYKLKIPPDFFLMIKAFTTIEGIAKILDPDFNMVAHATPYVKAAKFQKFSPSRLTEEFFSIARESFRLIQIFPSDIQEIMRLAKSGQLSFNMKIQGLDKLLHTQDQTSNRISFSIIIAALIIGSAMVINSRVPPVFFGVSVIGIAGFTAAAFLGIWLLTAIIRKGRL